MVNNKLSIQSKGSSYPYKAYTRNHRKLYETANKQSSYYVSKTPKKKNTTHSYISHHRKIKTEYN